MPLYAGKSKGIFKRNLLEMLHSDTFAPGKPAAKRQQMALAAAYRKQGEPKKTKENKFSAFGAADKISKRKYRLYRTMVETGGGKPLSYSKWGKAGRPAQ